MNTTIKIGMICLICMAVVMSGCMESDDAPTIDSVFDITEDKDIVFTIDLILGHNSSPGVMEVEMYDDDTATIIITTGLGEVVETGTWQFYRQSDDHTMFDITTDDTELRVALQTSGHAVAYIYEDHYTKCGEAFYGTWEQISIDTTDDDPIDDTPITSDEPDDADDEYSDWMPRTVMIYGYGRLIMEEDETVELCTHVEGCRVGTWQLVAGGEGSFDMFELDIDPHSSLQLNVDGSAKFHFLDTIGHFDGTWTLGIDRTPKYG